MSEDVTDEIIDGSADDAAIARKRRIDTIARARQTVLRIDAQLARARAERTLAAVEARQQRDAHERVHKDHLDSRANHQSATEQRLRRRHDEAMARARQILGHAQVYRSTDDSVSADGAFDFVLTTSAPDRYGDVVMLEGLDLDNFLSNPICLWRHDQNVPIGFWQDTHIAGDELRARLELLPKGTSAKADEIRKLVAAGVLRAASIGIRLIETERRAGSRTGGRVFLKSELMEASLVPLGANGLAVRRLG